MRTLSILLVGLSIFLLQPAWAEDPAELTSAIKPLEEGVPEVAVVRLREFLSKNRSGRRMARWRGKIDRSAARGESATGGIISPR